MPQEHQAILCPYCGHTQRKMDRCEACGGSFDPISKRGIAVNMGPWFLHDQRVPFRPGFNYTSMKRLINTGKVTATSIVRGPSTQQLWAPAKLAPGLAHLVGSCPRCETPTPTDATKCGNCAQPFEAEPAYNELGLPFETATQARTAQEELDREVARCSGRSRSLRLWNHPDVPMLSLCPYCGDWQKSADQCSTCGGVFDQLSQRATIIAMGPWFVRNKRFPYLPGCSLDVIRKQIAAKRIDASTIMRGPTTRQFWSVARNVPGISHLLGYCWSCGLAVKASDAKCESCDSHFGGVEKQNALGLSFATEAEALKAEQELEAKFNPMMPPTPVALPPVPVPMSGASALPKGTNSQSHAAVGQAAFTGLDRASLAVIAAAMIEPAARKQEVHQDQDVAAPVERQRTSRQQVVPTARPRRRASRKSHPVIVATLALSMVAGIVIGIVIFANQQKQGEPVDGGKSPPIGSTTNTGTTTPTTPTTPTKTDPPPVTPGNPLPPVATDLAAVKEQATRDWSLIKGTNREGQIGLSLDGIADLMASGDEMFAQGQAVIAASMYSEAIRAMEKLGPRIELRNEAAATRNKSADLLISLDPTDLPEAGIMMIEQTRMRFDEGQIHFDNGDFEKAIEVWAKVEVGLVHFEERMTGLTTVQAAEAGYLNAYDHDLDDALLTLIAGDSWREISALIMQARKATMDEKWDDAIAAYGKAAALTPDVMKIAKPLAVRYWSCLAGQVGAKAWHDHIDATTLDPRIRAAMRQLFNRLGLPFQPIDQAMLAPVNRKDVLKIVLLDPAAALQKAQGDAAVSTFQLGVHLISLSRLLAEDAAMPDDKRQREVALRLSDLKETAKAAGFNAKMTASISDMAEKLADLSEPTKVTKARAACDKLLNQLARADEAIDMLRE